MRYDQITEAAGVARLERKPQGFGLEVMYGEGLALVGGMRSGSSPSGLLRRAYTIMDTDLFQQTQNQDGSMVGMVEIFTDANNDIAGLINIKLSPRNRKAGMGSAVVRSLAVTAPKDLVIFDIRPSAHGFWKKMGTEFYNISGQPMTPKKGASGTMMGVIRKAGSKTPVHDLSGFRRPSGLPVARV